MSIVLNTLDAATHVELGEYGAAIEELRNANEPQCPRLFQILADPRLKPIENLPEFVALKSVWQRWKPRPEILRKAHQPWLRRRSPQPHPGD